MLVTKKNFQAFLTEFQSAPPQVGLDVETTGIWWWKSPNVPWYTPRVFSVQFSTTENRDYYLDFLHSDDHLCSDDWDTLRTEVFGSPSRYWFSHNAKFELHHLRNHGVTIAGTVHCTKHIQRVVNNLEEGMKLDDLCTKYLNAPKMDVKTYIEENKLWTEVKRYGSEDTEQWHHYDKLPLEMLVKYGERDTQLCRDLGLWQLQKISELDQTHFVGTPKRLSQVLENENRLTKTVFEMERVGIKIDRTYCEEAYQHEVAEYQALKTKLDKTTDEEVNWLSADQIKKYFNKRGVESFKLTKKGKMSFDKEALEAMVDDNAKDILSYRYHYKRAHTYFGSYLWLADSEGVLHCDLQNSGTETGRMSCWNPNLQNVPKRRDKDEEKYKVRRCFVPRPGFLLVDIDYSGAEFYMAMDYAREMKIVDKIKAGLDPHTFTKELFDSLGVKLKDRDTAKTMTFRLIYGAGGETVGASIGYKKGTWEAKHHGKKAKELYFQNFPDFAHFMTSVQQAARGRGYVFNWLGRILQYVNQGGFGVETWFKSPNGVIQGGIGDTLKVAMNQIQTLLTTPGIDAYGIGECYFSSRMVIPVHDAILFEMATDELHLLDAIKKIMVDAYPAKVLPLEVDVGYSETDWGSLQDSPPHVT